MKKKVLSVILALIVTLCLVPAKAFALTYPQTPGAQTQIIWEYLYQEIGNPYSVAAIMGNLNRESGLIPNITSATGFNADAWYAYTESADANGFPADGSFYGIAQWGMERKYNLYNYAKSMDGSVGNIYVQLGFLMSELNGSLGYVLAQLRAAGSIEEAFYAFYDGFERGPVAWRSVGIDTAYAFYNQFAGAVPAPQSDPQPAAEEPQTEEQASPETSSDRAAETPSEEKEETSGASEPVLTASANNEASAPEKQAEPQIVQQAPKVLSSDALLVGLGASAGEMHPQFSSWNTEYQLTVENDISYVYVTADKSDPNANVAIYGNTGFAVGSNNVINVYVTAENGNVMVYNIYVTRKSADDASSVAARVTRRAASLDGRLHMCVAMLPVKAGTGENALRRDPAIVEKLLYGNLDSLKEIGERQSGEVFSAQLGASEAASLLSLKDYSVIRSLITLLGLDQ